MSNLYFGSNDIIYLDNSIVSRTSILNAYFAMWYMILVFLLPIISMIYTAYLWSKNKDDEEISPLFFFLIFLPIVFIIWWIVLNWFSHDIATKSWHTRDYWDYESTKSQITLIWNILVLFWILLSWLLFWIRKKHNVLKSFTYQITWICILQWWTTLLFILPAIWYLIYKKFKK